MSERTSPISPRSLLTSDDFFAFEGVDALVQAGPIHRSDAVDGGEHLVVRWHIDGGCGTVDLRERRQHQCDTGDPDRLRHPHVVNTKP